ncbi:MAG: LacI family transcriptional regulator [Anaerolineaceae bacterium]|nr:LacI family transcriptional regulator [Anaerolineaceae bacterium]
MKNRSRITIYDVAEDAGISITTVSRVLNTPDRVSTSSCNKVMASIEKLGFVPKAEAFIRAKKYNGQIGIITPWFTFPSFVQRFRGISSGLVDTPFDFTIYPVESAKRLEGYFVRLPISQRLDGLIVVSLPIGEQEIKRLKQSGLPAVFIEWHVYGFSSIEVDDRQGGYMAGDHLIQKGHSRCAYVGSRVIPDYVLKPEDHRLEGYQQCLKDHGILLPSELIKLPEYPSDKQHHSIQDLLDQDNPPTAIFAASDNLAMSILKVARNRNIRVPEDLAVIGFDDIDIAEYLGLTTISQSLDKSGRLSAELLVAQILDPTRPIQNISMKLEIIERETT